VKGFAAYLRQDLAQLRRTNRLLQRLAHVEAQATANFAGQAKHTGTNAAYQNDFGTAAGIREDAEKFDPVATRHLEIEQHDARRLRGQRGLEYRWVGRDRCREAGGFGDLLNNLQEGWLVVDC
jgi:hypothetical protein